MPASRLPASEMNRPLKPSTPCLKSKCTSTATLTPSWFARFALPMKSGSCEAPAAVSLTTETPERRSAAFAHRHTSNASRCSFRPSTPMAPGSTTPSLLIPCPTARYTSVMVPPRSRQIMP